jgi:hypothetical protein
VFSAVRTTQARGAGCARTFRHDVHALAKASARPARVAGRSARSAAVPTARPTTAMFPTRS